MSFCHHELEIDAFALLKVQLKKKGFNEAWFSAFEKKVHIVLLN